MVITWPEIRTGCLVVLETLVITCNKFICLTDVCNMSTVSSISPLPLRLYQVLQVTFLCIAIKVVPLAYALRHDLCMRLHMIRCFHNKNNVSAICNSSQLFGIDIDCLNIGPCYSHIQYTVAWGAGAPFVVTMSSRRPLVVISDTHPAVGWAGPENGFVKSLGLCIGFNLSDCPWVFKHPPPEFFDIQGACSGLTKLANKVSIRAFASFYCVVSRHHKTLPTY